MDKEIKITTHVGRGGWFTASINGLPLIGQKGGPSMYRTRKEARNAAKERLHNLSPEYRKELGL